MIGRFSYVFAGFPGQAIHLVFAIFGGLLAFGKGETAAVEVKVAA